MMKRLTTYWEKYTQLSDVFIQETKIMIVAAFDEFIMLEKGKPGCEKKEGEKDGKEGK